jgi:hypothetical protein
MNRMLCDVQPTLWSLVMQKLVLAVTLLTALGAIAISGSLSAHQKSTRTSANAMDPAALTLKAKDLPVVQVNEPF